MEGTRAEKEKSKKHWRFYLISGISFLLTVLLAVGVVFFWEEVQQAQGFGYTGGFVVSILGGVTVIPVPSLLVTFTLGRVLNPVYVGLISGLGEALGGITVYLTGAGVGTMWSKLRIKEQNFADAPGHAIVEPIESRFWPKGQAVYNRLVHWVDGKGGSWVVFIVSAMVFSPFYFAGLAAGTLRIGLLRFFLLSWAGKTVKGMTVAFAGYWGLFFLVRLGGA